MRTILDNVIEINFDTQEKLQGKLSLSKDIITTSSTILANLLLDYAKQGGDMEHITPQIFSKD